MPSYAKNKVHIYKWREQNLEKYRSIGTKHKRWKTIQMVFLSILLN